MTALRVALLVCLATALGACANAVVVTRNYIPQRGVPGHADYAAALGPVPVVTVNSPFPAPAVLNALLTNDPRRHQFTAEPPATLQGGYRVLLAFDRPVGGGLHVCRDPFTGSAPAPAPAAAPTRISVYGAFCLGPALLSEAVATAPRITTPDDPRLARLMGDLLIALMPFRDPYDNGDDGTRCAPC